MDEYQGLNHSKWDCKYHVVFIPKCRRKTLYAGFDRIWAKSFADWPGRRKAGSRKGI